MSSSDTCTAIYPIFHTFQQESAKLRAKRARRAIPCYVPTCLRAYVPNFLTCQRAMTCYVPTCLRAYVPNFLTCQRAIACYVPTCLRAKFSYVPTCHDMLRANVPACQIYLRANVPLHVTCQRACDQISLRANVPLHVTCKHPYVPACHVPIYLRAKLSYGPFEGSFSNFWAIQLQTVTFEANFS